MRKRRIAFALLLLLAGAGALTFALRPSGGQSSTGTGQHAQSSPALSHIVVPVDSYERKWRAWIESNTGYGISRSSALVLRRKVVRITNQTGATLLRIRIWRKASPVAVEVALATAIDPAFYLRHRLGRLVTSLGGHATYVKVVDPRGSRIFEWYERPGEGMVGVSNALMMCSPVQAIGAVNPPPCPAK